MRRRIHACHMRRRIHVCHMMTLHTYEEEDTCISYEEEDTCMSYDDVVYRDAHDGKVKPVGPLGVERLKPVVAVCKDVEHQL